MPEKNIRTWKKVYNQGKLDTNARITKTKKKETELCIFEYIETFYSINRRHSYLKNLTIKEYNQLFNNNLKNVA